MSKQNKNFRRGHPRVPLMPSDVTAQIIVSDIAAPIGCQIWDVSDGGLKMWIKARLTSGEDITVKISAPVELALVAKVVWCEPCGDDLGYECGLMVTGHLHKLAHLRRVLESLPSAV